MPQRAAGRSPIFPLLLLLCVVLGATAGIATTYYARHASPDNRLVTVINLFDNNWQAAFSGKEQINLLVMGIDDNWTNKDIVYTKNARTDTLFVMRLDMANRRAYLLSIPRDSRVHIAGTRHWGKINGAYATGGVPRATATVEEFLGIPIDHYVVLRIDATRKLVDSLGGVDINVEKDMKYDDNWGHLHIHLKKGLQHLDGEQAVGYIRFRHDRDGDFGRIRRQQQLLHAIADEMKSPGVWGRAQSLLTTFRQFVDTDLTDSQVITLAYLFHSVDPSQIVSSYIPGADQRIGGVWFLVPDEEKKGLTVDWLLKGNAASEIPLIQVAVENGCGSAAAAVSVRDRLRDAGFEAYLDGSADRSDYASTQVIDFGRLKGAGSLVASKLGVSTPPLVQPDPQADTHAVVIVGRDMALATVASRASQS